MNNVSLSSKVIYWNPKDFAVSQNFNKVIRENEKVSNDYYWKSNKSEGVDCFGRALDLTTLINKPDGYLQGRLADADDADYYQFNIAEYRILGTVSDKHNLDITVTLDHIPEGCDYELVLYDGDGNQVGIGQDNGSGGKSVTVPNWNCPLYTFDAAGDQLPFAFAGVTLSYNKHVSILVASFELCYISFDFQGFY